MTLIGKTGSVQIRPLQPVDLDGVMPIAASLRDAPHWPRAVYEAALQPGAVPERLCLVAISDGALAGFLVAAVIAGQAEIESIAVALEHQRRGIGTTLLDAAIETLRSRDVAEVFLEVRACNAAAQALYRTAGFAECGRRTGYYADPVDDAILLRLVLAI